MLFIVFLTMSWGRRMRLCLSGRDAAQILRPGPMGPGDCWDELKVLHPEVVPTKSKKA